MATKKTRKNLSPKNKHFKFSPKLIGLIILLIILALLVKNIDKIQDLRSSASNTQQLQTAVYTLSDLLNQSNQNTRDETTKITNWIGNAQSVKNSYLGLRFNGPALNPNVQIVDAKLTVTSSKTLREKLMLNVYAEKNSNPVAYKSGVELTYPSNRKITFSYDYFNNNEVKWLKDEQYTIPATKAIKEATLNGVLNQGWVNLIVKGVSKKSYDFYYIYNNLVSGKGPILTITYYSSANVIPVWKQPTGAHDAYQKGDRVHFPAADSPVYESLIDANTWSPTGYPSGWLLIA